jgi:hypothetical protein
MRVVPLAINQITRWVNVNHPVFRDGCIIVHKHRQFDRNLLQEAVNSGKVFADIDAVDLDVPSVTAGSSRCGEGISVPRKVSRRVSVPIELTQIAR